MEPSTEAQVLIDLMESAAQDAGADINNPKYQDAKKKVEAFIGNLEYKVEDYQAGVSEGRYDHD